MKRKSGRKPNKKEENDSNGVEDTEQNGDTSDHEEEEPPKEKRRKSSKGGRKNVSFSGKKDKEDATSTAESEISEDADLEEDSHKEEKKSRGRKSSKKEVKETDPLANSEEEIDQENEKKKSPKKGKKGGKKDKSKEEKQDKKEQKEDDIDEEDDSQYEVEAVLDEKIIRGIRHYLIRWKGYEEESDTWEPEDTLDCKELINEFKEKKKKEKGSKKSHKKDKKDDEQEDWDENADFEVNRILEVHHTRDGKREFLINWKGYGQGDNSWEPEENLDCKELIEKFMNKVDRARELEDRELRQNRKQVQRYTLSPQAEARRMSRRFRGKERVQYHDAE